MAVPAIMKMPVYWRKNRRKISAKTCRLNLRDTLVLAQSSGTTVKMTIISEAGAQTTQTPDAFLTSYQRQMCADPTVKLMITEGINYSITINDTRTGNQYQRKLDRTTCGIVKA